MNDSVQIKAPFGAKLHLHNFTYWELGTNRIQSAVTSFSLGTQPCPIGTYSINRGSSKGFTIENHVKCIPCPTGGNCTSFLAARPNFWGYPLDDKVYFTFCPQGYCCAAVNQKSRYHNSSYLNSGCQGNRTGILCGRCKKDFSDTLFTTRCLPARDCTHRWYLVIIFICTLSFALFLIRKPPVFKLLMKNLTWFLPSDKRKDYEDTSSLDSGDKTNGTASYGFLKITFYFYQIAGVLTISNYGVSGVLKDNIVLPAISLLDFKISVNNDWSICPFPGITPLSKTLFQLAAVTAIFMWIPFIYLLHSGLNKLRKRTSALPPSGPYLGAILEIVLLGYSAATGTATKLLNCVNIQHVSRWYYDADITCYQWWQNASIAAIALFLFPFILTLYFASLRLYRGQLSAKMFVLACVFPLPCLLLVLVFHVNKVITQPRDCKEMTSTTTLVNHEDEKDTCNTPSTIEQSVLEVLSAPFCKPKDDQSHGRIYWESVLIGRRFILILIGSFVEPAFLRSVCLSILCLFFLLHHISRKPFAQFRANLAETVSLATLVVIAILNVGVTSYYSAGLEAWGVQSECVQIFLLTEAVLLCFVPLVFAAVVLLSLVSQLVRLTIILIQAVQWLVYKSKLYSQGLRMGQYEPLSSSA
ncbi:hypothetical protein OS493_012069 [Desmophyllum pertusum]|uniref:Uncharacterized protein n=1 Tax=Desmophyllum pertusum TaxID=174260 RepID=A0A9X0A2U0_9CNID|nr:hypothetical protein OS493_012069 [Desmophyllum pertusum]